MPRISVIIPVYNDADRLRLCLDALEQQTMPHDQFEVIVVDNGSTDPPSELVNRYPFAQLVHEAKSGSYAARNHGLSIAQGDLVAFTDADCVPTPNWLEAGTAAVEAAGETKVVVSGEIVIFAHDQAAPSGAELYDMAFGLNQEANLQAGFFPTANLFAKRNAFDEAGCFNTEVMSGGDALWCQAATSCGYSLRFVEEVTIRHPARESLSDLVRQARRFVGGRLDRGHRRNPWSLHYWRVVWRAVVPNVPKMLRARQLLRKHGYGAKAWVRTLPVILSVQYSQLFELIRKRLGFSSERL